MLQLDPTTQSSLEAATTPSARAAAILSSLSGTITVTVRDGTGATKGSGTMPSFGTQSANVIVLNNVTSFTVSETGTPDPETWTIEFANAGGRFVKGTFGLYTSPVAEFKWSLATWENGQSGTIASAYCTVRKNEVLSDVTDTFNVAATPTNVAPIWLSNRPTSFTATQGTVLQLAQYAYDPDSLNLTYSITSFIPSGYSINSSTGELTVGAANASLVVRVQDSFGASADWNIPVIVSSSTELPATKIVQADGGGGAYTTIQSAINAAVAGDVIEVRANTPGTTQQFSESLNFQNKNYASYVILRARTGDTIRIDSPPSTSYTSADSTTVYAQTLLFIKASSRIKFHGRWIFGSETGWSQATSGTVRNYDRGLHFTDGSNRIEMGDGINRITVYGSRRYTGNLITQTCDYLKFNKVDFDLHGTNNDARVGDPNFGSDLGNLFEVGSYRTVFKDCSFSRGGHEPISSVGQKQVFRGCLFSGDWRAMNTGYPGSRAGAFVQGWSISRRVPRDARPTENGPVLVEDCSFKLTGRSVDQVNNDFVKIENGHTIWRFNDLTDAQIGGAEAATDPYAEPSFSGPNYCHIYSYNNTIFGSFGWQVDMAENSPLSPHPESHGNWHYRNNLYAQLSHQFTSGGVRPVFRRRMGATSFGPYPNHWKGSEIAYNLYQYVGQVGFDTVEGLSSLGGTATVTLNNSTQWPSNWHDNVSKTIQFTNVGTFGNRTRAGLTLSSTSKADPSFAQVPLTYTSSSGTNTTTVPVQRARFFYDGWGMQELGEVGDTIVVGSSITQIVSINYDTNVLTVATPISYSTNTGINLIKNGTPLSYKGAMQ